jgi:response regulator RpfG family c-di-GMP phosphodiesterase
MATILWIDDETLGFMNRKLLPKKCGYDLPTATAVRPAIELFINNPVELVILDCHMALLPSAMQARSRSGRLHAKTESALTLLTAIYTLVRCLAHTFWATAA